MDIHALNQKHKAFVLIVASLILTGCSTPEERALRVTAKTEGLVLHNKFTSTCNSDAWSAYPSNIQPVTVQKVRTERRQTGMECTQDITWKDQQNCENTYRNVNVTYNVTEHQDINSRARSDFFTFCLSDSCTSSIDKEGEFKLKTRFCNRGGW